jgi:hypothetical protein
MTHSSKITTGKATLYTRNGFGAITRIEVKQASIEIRQYAQYNHAVECRFRKPRQRVDRGFVQTFQPDLLVLDGWGHPAPGAAFESVSESADCSVSRARYSACDPRWARDFNAQIDAYLARSGARVVADYRGHCSA